MKSKKLEEATMLALQGKLNESKKVTEGNEPEAKYRAVEIIDASEPNTHYMTIMLNYKHTVDEFQNAMWEAHKRNEAEIDEYGNDLEVVLGDIDPSFDWYELEETDEKLTI